MCNLRVREKKYLLTVRQFLFVIRGRPGIQPSLSAKAHVLQHGAMIRLTSGHEYIRVGPVIRDCKIVGL